ncbi:MAG: 3-isopropylmalate dehydratase small subunit, partial [Salinivirgaceae bacterium]|nr:3-isopropylmalate dehydratase small subunit [Salinivirgaceae bacterium]
EFQQELFASIEKDPKTLVTVDVPNQTVTNEATGRTEKFEINGYKKHCLVNALDDIDYLLSVQDKTEAFEKKAKQY